MTNDISPSAPTPVSELTFEQAQAELEAIVEQLEDQHTGLDAALALWERGEALHRHCQSKLDYAAERIQRLQVSADEVAAVDSEGTVGDFEPARSSGQPAGAAATEDSGEMPSMF
jgi:exodeoxyribonuclease VII small subunit